MEMDASRNLCGLHAKKISLHFFVFAFSLLRTKSCACLSLSLRVRGPIYAIRLNRFRECNRARISDACSVRVKSVRVRGSRTRVRYRMEIKLKNDKYYISFNKFCKRVNRIHFECVAWQRSLGCVAQLALVRRNRGLINLKFYTCANYGNS